MDIGNTRSRQREGTKKNLHVCIFFRYRKYLLCAVLQGQLREHRTSTEAHAVLLHIVMVAAVKTQNLEGLDHIIHGLMPCPCQPPRLVFLLGFMCMETFGHYNVLWIFSSVAIISFHALIFFEAKTKS